MAEPKGKLLEAAETEYYHQLSRLHSLEADALERTKAETLASPQYTGIYTFYGSVNSDSVKTAMRDLGAWARREPEANFRIVFNSPGGSVIDGFAFFDFIKELRSLGHNIETVALGYAASMGGILLQAGDKRVIGSNAYMLIHEISSFAFGKASELEDELKLVKRLQEKALDILAERSTMNKSQIKRKWVKTDWWIDAAEALEFGFVDEIR
jgi:ATP-dependent Clp endopeptidase proteolytic subunit ClpP